MLSSGGALVVDPRGNGHRLVVRRVQAEKRSQLPILWIGMTPDHIAPRPFYNPSNPYPACIHHHSSHVSHPSRFRTSNKKANDNTLHRCRLLFCWLT